MKFWELFRGYINARALKGRVGSWWLFKGVGCSLLIVVVKEETKAKKLDAGTSLSPSLPSPSYSVSHLVIGAGSSRDKGGGGKENPQSRKDKLQSIVRLRVHRGLHTWHFLGESILPAQ